MVKFPPLSRLLVPATLEMIMRFSYDSFAPDRSVSFNFRILFVVLSGRTCYELLQKQIYITGGLCFYTAVSRISVDLFYC